MTDYVAGLLFSDDTLRVALIHKKRPAWQAGKYNAIGGKVEPGEEPVSAMAREFREETGADVRCWVCFAVLTGHDWRVFCFYAIDSRGLDSVQTLTDEVVHVFRLGELGRVDVVPNLTWLVPMALDAYDRLATFEVRETA